MINVNSKPELKEILDLKERLQQVWAEAHEKWEVADSYYRRSFDLWPKGMDRPSYHPSTAARIIDHAVDQQMAYHPKFHREPKGEGEVHKERADRVETAMAAIMEAVGREEMVLPWKQVGKHLLLYGYAVVEGPMYVPLAVPVKVAGESKGDYAFRRDVYEMEKQDWMPVRVRAVHPSTVLMDPMTKRPRFAIKVSQRYAYEIEELSLRKARTRRDVMEWRPVEPYDEILVTEFWSAYWHAFIVDREVQGGRNGGDMLYVERNSWSYCPYGHGFSGFGALATATQGPRGQYAATTGTSGHGDPSDMAVSLLEPIMESLKVQAQAATGKHNALMEAAFNVRGTTREAAEMAEQLSRADLVEMRPGELWWLDVPNLPAWLFQVGQEVDRDIELGTYSMQLAGVKEPGVSTVGQQAILSQAAGRKFVAPMRQMEDMATNVARNLLRLVQATGEAIGEGKEVLTPQDVDEHYNINATFELVDPVLALQQRELGMREYQLGLKSDESYWATDARMEDVAGERKRLLKQAVRNTPEVQHILARAVAQEMGLVDELEALTAEVEEEQRQREVAAATATPLVGPDGVGLGQGMGAAATLGSPGGPAAAVRQLRQPLAPATAKPGLVQVPPQRV